MTEANEQIIRSSPQGFVLMAREFFQAYNLLQSKYPKKVDHFFVKYYNLCHAYELILKALLLDRGVQIEELRAKPLGHNLVNLLYEFKDRYPEEKVTKIDEAITRLVNTHYHSKEFEYHRVGLMQVPDINQLDGLVNGFLLIAERHTKIPLPNHKK